MNQINISPDALIRFRHAASQYARTQKSRASGFARAQRGHCCAAQTRSFLPRHQRLLTQCGIKVSATCVINFCHRTLKERRRKPSAARRATPDANLNPTRKTAPNATAKSALPATPATTGGALPVPNESAPVKIRGPHIAKVELLPPGEQYD